MEFITTMNNKMKKMLKKKKSVMELAVLTNNKMIQRKMLKENKSAMEITTTMNIKL
jgi:hypothetical protein